MSINTAHANNGVLIHAGEAILLFSENVTMDFSGQDDPAFRGTKHGSIYLTTHRMIYNAKKFEEPMKSFSFPFICMTDVEVEQPLFGANYIRGKVRAQENGNFIGEAKFKLVFKAGGCIDFAQAMLRAAHMAKQNANNGAPPPYTPTGAWHEVPPPAYQPNPSGYYGWMPNTTAFPDQPNNVYMADDPPPYPGIVPPNAQGGYPNQPPSYQSSFSQPAYPPQAGGYPQAGFQQPGYPQPGYPQSAQQQPGYPQPGYPQTGYPLPGYPQSGYPQPGQQPPGYPQPGQQPPGYPQPGQQQPGYPQPPAGYADPSSGPNHVYPQVPPPTAFNPFPTVQNQSLQQSAYQQQPSANPSYPTNSMGYAPPPNSKEAEAARSAYNDSQQPHASRPSSGYNEPPPSYSSLQQSPADKKNQ